MTGVKYSLVYVIVCVLAWGWPTPTVARADSWDLLQWPRNAKLSVEAGWGLPCGWLSGGSGKVDDVSIIRPGWGMTLRSQVSSNWRFGIVGWHGFFKDQEEGSFALGPEIGLFLGSKQRIILLEVGNYGQIFEEHVVEAYALHVPVCAQLTLFSEEKVSKALELKVGYEFSFIYSLRYQRSSHMSLQSHTKSQFSWKANRVLFSGSLILGGTVYFLQGCYLAVLLKAPIEALVRLEQSHERDRLHKHRPLSGHPHLFYGAWASCTSLVEFSIGIDIVDFLLED